MILNRQNRPPLFFSQILIALFIFMFCVLHGAAFARYTSIVGYLSVLVLIWEIWRSGRIYEVPRYLLPILPFALFVLTCIAVIPLIPYTAPIVRSIITGFVLLTTVYLIARMQGNTRIIQYGFVAVIIGLCGIIFLDPSVSAKANERLRLSASFLEADSGGLNASNISVYFGLGMFMAAGLMLHYKNAIHVHFLQKLTYWGLWGSIAMATTVIVLYSGSRQGLVWVILVAGFLGVLFFRKNIGLAILAAFVLTLVAIAGFAVFGQNTLLYDRVFLIVNSEARMLHGEDSFSGRLEMIRFGLEMWQQSPFFGNGNEAFRINYGKYSHNNYVELLANYGIIGLGFYYMPFAILVIALLPLLKRGQFELKSESAWVLACILAILVSNFFIPAYYSRPSLAFMGFIIGRGWFLVNVQRRAMASLRHMEP